MSVVIVVTVDDLNQCVTVSDRSMVPAAIRLIADTIEHESLRAEAETLVR